MALPNYSLQPRNIAIDSLLITADDYNLAPTYQRGSVWATPRKIALIKSLLMGVPIGAVVFNDRFSAGFAGFDVTSDPSYAVIDGKQRIEAIRGFAQDEYPIPRTWFDKDYVDDAYSSADEVYFSQLTLSGQRKFRNRPLVAIYAQVPTEADETEIFDLINFGGVAQGDKDSSQTQRKDTPW